MDDLTYHCDLCLTVMNEEPDYEFSGKDEGNLAVLCTTCVDSIVRFCRLIPSRILGMPEEKVRVLTVPEHDSLDSYPGEIMPGNYDQNQVVSLLRSHASDPETVRFIADMLEV